MTLLWGHTDGPEMRLPIWLKRSYRQVSHETMRMFC